MQVVKTGLHHASLPRHVLCLVRASILIIHTEPVTACRGYGCGRHHQTRLGLERQPYTRQIRTPTSDPAAMLFQSQPNNNITQHSKYLHVWRQFSVAKMHHRSLSFNSTYAKAVARECEPYMYM
jgi:hypothetical protein